MVTDNQRLHRTIREDSPCMGCTERFTACCDRCPKDSRGEFGYLAWKAKVQAVKDAKKAYQNLSRRKSWVKRV